VLDVEVLAFEEIRGKVPAARIQLRILIHDDYRALVEKTITVDRPVTASGDSTAALVLAMSEALDAAAEQVADAAATTPRATSPSEQPAPVRP
jgi:hypothetical protein